MGDKFTFSKVQSFKKPVFGFDKPWLAPLAGYSDLPFRLLCREYGASVCETEMISARGLLFSTHSTARLLVTTPEDQPLVVQLFGDDPTLLGQAVKLLRGAGFDWFDLNLGCPVRKVMRQGAGSALLKEPERIVEMARAMIAACGNNERPGGVGFKLRPGFDPDHPVLPDLALRLEDAGASWLALHPRFASQGFGGEANWEWIARLAARLKIPLLASGDLMTARDAFVCMEKTGASGVMYARGALKNPAIFMEHARLGANLKPIEPCRDDLRSMIERHLFLAQKYESSKGMFLKMRSLIPRYARGLPGVNEFRKALCQCASWEELSEILQKFLDGALVERESAAQNFREKAPGEPLERTFR